MKKVWISLLLTSVLGTIIYYIALPAMNIKSIGCWLYVITVLVCFSVIYYVVGKIGERSYGKWEYTEERFLLLTTSFIAATSVIILICYIVNTPMFNAEKYYNRIYVETGDFNQDIKQVDFSQLALVDKDSSVNLGDRAMGQMAELVSQFYVSKSYTQISYQDEIKRVTPLEYDGIIKFFMNRENGIPAYIAIDSVTGEAKLEYLDIGMKYSESAILGYDLRRKLRFSHLTEIFGEINFEIDDEGNPYYVVQTIKYMGISQTSSVDGIIVFNPINGISTKYELNDVPEWVDHVQSSDLIIKQLNHWGKYKNGFLNSVFASKEVVMTTEGYNYLSIENDIYLYTGITSVASDESNIGFVLVNLRTKEATFYAIAGAEEYSAMASSEGEVQQMSYEATFPLLVNLDSKPTYVLSLKDSAGLVKMYAFVDYADYQKVVVTNSSEGILKAAENYLGITISGETNEDTIQIEEIASCVIAGNTMYYILSKDEIYVLDINLNPSIAAFLQIGDKISIKYDIETNNIVEILK